VPNHLLGKNKQQEHEFLYWEYPASGGQQAVRWGKWKGIRKNILRDSLRTQLYDLETDIQEQNNIAINHPEIIEKIESFFIQQHTPSDINTFKIRPLGD
jgi:hypothetical protein